MRIDWWDVFGGFLCVFFAVLFIVLLFILFPGRVHAFEDRAFNLEQGCNECAYSTKPYVSLYDGTDTTGVLVAGAKHESRDIREPKQELVIVAQDEPEIVVTTDLGKMPYTICTEGKDCE